MTNIQAILIAFGGARITPTGVLTACLVHASNETDLVCWDPPLLGRATCTTLDLVLHGHGVAPQVRVMNDDLLNHFLDVFVGEERFPSVHHIHEASAIAPVVQEDPL